MFRSLTQIILAIISTTFKLDNLARVPETAGTHKTVMVLKVDNLVGDVSVAVSELN